MTSVYQHEMHQLWLSHPSFTSQTSQWFVFFSMGVWDRPFATDTIFCGKKNGIVSTIYRSSDLMMVLNSCASWEYVVYPCLSHYLISTDNLIIIKATIMYSLIYNCISHSVIYQLIPLFCVCVCFIRPNWHYHLEQRQWPKSTSWENQKNLDVGDSNATFTKYMGVS